MFWKGYPAPSNMATPAFPTTVQYGFEEGIIQALERQKAEVWRKLVGSSFEDLYQVQAEARVIERMINEASDRIANSLQQSKRRH